MSSRDDDLVRRKQLVYNAIKNKGAISFDKSGYKDNPQLGDAPKKKFTADCNFIVEKANRLNSVLTDPLALPAVTVSVDKHDGLHVGPIRPFAESLNESEKLSSKLKALAHRVVGYRLEDGEYLVPRESSIFLAFGRTTFWISVEMIKIAEQWGDIHTSGFEIAARFYFAAPVKYVSGARRLYVSGGEVDWREGTLKPSTAESIVSDTVIVGFDSLPQDGRCWAKGEETTIAFTKKAIENATRRVIFVGIAEKVGGAQAGHYHLPFPTEKEVFVVTDGPTRTTKLPSFVKRLELNNDGV